MTQEAQENDSSSTGAGHRRDRSDFTGDVTPCSSSADIADDRGGCSTAVHRVIQVVQLLAEVLQFQFIDRTVDVLAGPQTQVHSK